MSGALLAQQSALLAAIASSSLSAPEFIANYSINTGANGLKSPQNTVDALRGLRVYRANAQALCVSALQASHPVLQQLLGEENFRHLAQDFWQAMPPGRGDVAQWGQDVAHYLAQVPPLQALLSEHPYLCDVARLEWALHTAATASDAALDAPSFQRLTQADPAQLRLLLSPGCAVLRSAYPVVSIIQLHDGRQLDVHEEARQAIAAAQAQTALIWRQGFRPLLAQVDIASAALIESTLQGQSLAAALDAALAQEADFDFSAWLSASVHRGLLCAVIPV